MRKPSTVATAFAELRNVDDVRARHVMHRQRASHGQATGQASGLATSDLF